MIKDILYRVGIVYPSVKVVLIKEQQLEKGEIPSFKRNHIKLLQISGIMKNKLSTPGNTLCLVKLISNSLSIYSYFVRSCVLISTCKYDSVPHIDVYFFWNNPQLYQFTHTVIFVIFWNIIIINEFRYIIWLNKGFRSFFSRNRLVSK